MKISPRRQKKNICYKNDYRTRGQESLANLIKEEQNPLPHSLLYHSNTVKGCVLLFTRVKIVNLG